MNKIRQIESEVETLKSEIAKLKQSQADCQNLPAGNKRGDSGAELLLAAKNERMMMAELADIKMAIATLEHKLVPKLEALEDLRAEEQQAARQDRVQAGRVKLGQTTQKINNLAAELETAYCELKDFYKEYNLDHRATQKNPGNGAGWQIQDLITFNRVALPKVMIKGDCFIIDAEFIDLFKPEKDAALAKQMLTRAEKQNSRQQLIEQHLKKEDLASRHSALQRLQRELSEKCTQLNTIEKAKKDALAAGAKAGKGPGFRLDSSLDNRIGALEREINNLQVELGQLQEAK